VSSLHLNAAATKSGKFNMCKSVRIYSEQSEVKMLINQEIEKIKGKERKFKKEMIYRITSFENSNCSHDPRAWIKKSKL